MNFRSLIVSLCLATSYTLVSAQSFCNSSSISIPNVGTSGIASPYPSTINVTGAPTIGKVTVNLNGLTHTFGSDIDILLVSPTGANTIVMSDVGGRATNVNLTFDDAAASSLISVSTSGTFRPTNNGIGDSFPSAPTASSTVALSNFNGTNPNGTWSLYVVDDLTGDSGTLNQWCINISPPPITVTTTTLPNPQVGVSYTQTLNATDGVAPYSYSVTAGSLPAGLSLSTAGVLSGTPTTAGNASFTITASDGVPTTPGSRAFSVTVEPAAVVDTTSIPTLNEWGLMILASLMGIFAIRRRNS